MRKDIEIHINTGDIILKATNKYKLRPFRMVDNPEGLERYAYAEIEIPDTIPGNAPFTSGIYVSIPYTPIYKEFAVRIKRVVSDDDFSYVTNPADGSEWFIVQTGRYGDEMENAYLSELFLISEDNYFIILKDSKAQLYAADQLDFNIINCDRQNSNLLISCVPTNNYRYPLTGVGLIRWINSSMNSSELTDTLMREFSEDGMTINTARFDQDTKQLHLDATTTATD
jgi:hypothetical protein